MQDKFTTVSTGSFEKKENDSGVYIKQYQLIKNTRTGETSLGLVFENISQKDVSSAEVEAVFAAENGEETAKTFTADILDGHPGSVCPMKSLFETGGDFVSVRLSVKSVNYGKVNEKPAPAVLTAQKGKSHKPADKKKVLIAVLVIIAVICAAVGIFLIVSPDDSGGHGMGHVIGKGDASYAETTANADKNTASEEESKLAEAGGHNVSSSGQKLDNAQMPDELAAFVGGHFYLDGTIYSASTSGTDKLTLSINGSDHFMTEDKGDIVIGICSASGVNYYVNMKNSTYLEVTDALLEKLGMTKEDFRLKIFDMSLIKDYALYSSTVDSKDGLCLVVNYRDGYCDRVYYADGRVVQINAYDAQSNLLESIICNTFSREIPGNMSGVSGYTRVDSYEEFFNALVGG